ncbi:MAG: type II toxin-antitoxin system VapC family toxin, partial [Candidatus Scalindua sp.]
TQPEHDRIRKFIAENTPAVSSISYVEVLGYHRLTDQDRHYFERFFQLAQVLSISDSVLKQAVLLRQQKKMTLGDSIIAGTALDYGLELITKNTIDFQWIQGLKLINPFDDII